MSRLINLRRSGARIAVICDPPHLDAKSDCAVPPDRHPSVPESRGIMLEAAWDYLHRISRRSGDLLADASFFSCAPSIPYDCVGSDKRTLAFIQEYEEPLHEALEADGPWDLIVCLGKYAARQYLRSNVKITKVRGQIRPTSASKPTPLLVVHSPQQVRIQPHLAKVFESDLRLGTVFRDAAYNYEVFQEGMSTAAYSVHTDLQWLVEAPPKGFYADTETIGNRWYGDAELLCLQLCWGEHQAIMVPLHLDWYRKWSELLEREIEKAEQERKHGHRDKLITFLEDYQPMTEEDMERLHSQVRQLTGNPRIGFAGHNFKYDVHILERQGMKPKRWVADTMQLAFVADENMERKALSECVRRWVPPLAGYSDEFDRNTDKSRMDLVCPMSLTEYGCGDVDAGYRLYRELNNITKDDPLNRRLFDVVQMPALRVFARMENYGINIDTDALTNLQDVLAEREAQLYRQILRAIPTAVKRKFLDAAEDDLTKGRVKIRDVLSLGRDALILEWLFTHSRGLRLRPVMFTKTTARLGSGDWSRTAYERGTEVRVPQTGKDHLAMFNDNEAIALLVEWKQVNKMRSTYVGNPASAERKSVEGLKSGKWPKAVYDVFGDAGIEPPPNPGKPTPAPEVRQRRRRRISMPHEAPPPAEAIHRLRIPVSSAERYYVLDAMNRLHVENVKEAKGFWQYLWGEQAVIHPSFFLHRTVTGRTSSSDPNGQNIPKHGDLAKAFRKIFVPPPGWKFLECDLSQIELRLLAWEAEEPTMLAIYNSGGDIHASTAAAAMGIDYAQFRSFKDSPEPYNDPNYSWISTKGEAYGHYRFLAKAINFGFAYGMWWPKFKEYARTDYGLTLTDTQAREFRERFFAQYPRLEAWHREQQEFVRQCGYVRALHGAKRSLPNIASYDEGIRKEAGRQAINSPIQRFGSDLGLMGMVRFGRDCPWDRMHPVGFIHDATVLAVREDSLQEAATAMKFYMQSTPLDKWFNLHPPLPILADVAGPGDDLSGMPDMDVEAVAPDWARLDRDARFFLEAA